MKLGFVTCVQLGLSCIEEIAAQGIELDIIITLKDNKAQKKSGRIFLDDYCIKNKIKLYKINHINDQDVENIIIDNKIDYLFIIGWSQIANKRILDLPRYGTLGMHPTLLPIGRGRASIPWTILKGLKETGVTLFKLDEGVDTGPIIMQSTIKVENNENATSLYKKIEIEHINLISKAIKKVINNNIKMYVQDESKATVWPGRKPEQGLINKKNSVYEAERLVRALTKPYPGAFIVEGKYKTIIWKAHLDYKLRIASVKHIKFYDGYLIFDEYETKYKE